MERKEIEGELIFMPQEHKNSSSPPKKPSTCVPQSNIEPRKSKPSTSQQQKNSPQSSVPPTRIKKPESSSKSIKKFVAACVAMVVLGLILVIAVIAGNSPANKVRRSVDAGNYEKAVQVYNERIAGDEKKEEAVNTDFEALIVFIQESFINGNMSVDEAMSSLNVICGIENEMLTSQADDTIKDIANISDGHTQWKAGARSKAINMYLRVAEDKKLYTAACGYIDSCAEELLDVAVREKNDVYLRELLDVVGLLSDRQEFGALVKEIDTVIVRLTHSIAEEFAQNGDYQNAMAIAQNSLNVCADNQELKAIITEYQLQYEQFITSQVMERLAGKDYVSAVSLVVEALNVDADNEVFLDLQTSVVAKYICDQVNSYVASEDYTKAFELIAQVCKADSHNDVYKNLEQTTLKSYESFVSDKAQAFVSKNDYTSAITLVEVALKDYPDNQRFLELKTSLEEAKVAYEKKVSEFTNKDVEFIQYDGSISAEDEIDTYKLTTKVSGQYRFDVNNMISGFKVNLYIYDDQNGELEASSSYGLVNGEGITVYLSGNHTYSVKVKQYRNTGTYRLNIGQPKPMVDISLCNTVYDSIQYTDQRNWYKFTPEVSGYYRFKLTNMVNGFKPNMWIYDDLDYVVEKQEYGIAIDEGLTAYLEKGRTYEIAIRDYRGSGSYELLIGKQKPRATLEENVNFTDEITFVDQRNYYNFTPTSSGTYVFELTGMRNSVKMNLFVVDSLNYTLGKNEYGVASGECITANLIAGETYTIRVTHYRGTDAYTLRAYYQNS